MWGGVGGAGQCGSGEKGCQWLWCQRGVGVVLALPLLDEGVDSINQAVLRNGVEEADKIIIGGMKGDVGWCVLKVAVEVGPQLWD